MTGERFLFNNNVFDDDPLIGMEEEEIARPEFTKEQLEKERNKAYEIGKKAGFKESEEGLTKSTVSLLQKIQRDMSILFAAEHDRAIEYESEAVHLSLSIIQKLFPLYTQKYGQEELEAAIKACLTQHSSPSKIQIELHGDILDKIKPHIDDLGNDFGKEIKMIANNKLSMNECNISWLQGGIIFNRDLIAEKTLQIMKETLAERGINVHDKEAGKEDKKDAGET